MARILRRRDTRISINTSAAFMTTLEYLWAFFVVMNGNSVYHANATTNLHLLEMAIAFTVVLLIVNIVHMHIHPSRMITLIMVVIMMYSTIYLTAKQTDMTAGTFMQMFVLGAPVAFLLFAELHRQGRLFKLFYRFVDILCVLSVISLVFWIFGEMLGLIQRNGYVEVRWGTFDEVEGYYGIHFAFQLDTTFFPDELIYRNSGIFAEAPMFNLWLSIALAIELFLKEKASKGRIALLAITMLTTMSVTGILFLALCIALCAMLRYRQMGRLGKGALWCGALVAVPVLISVLTKSMSLKSETQSYDMRLSDYVGGVRLWMDHPVFGGGYGNLGTLLPYIYAPDGVVGFSNSITAVLGTGGIWMAMLFYIPLFGMLIPRLAGSKKIACFGACYMFLFCTTAFFGRYIAVIMIAFGLAVITGAKYRDDKSAAMKN